MSILVTGGAGYIGSHIVRALGLAGLDSVVIDDLSSGHREFVPEGVPFIQASLLDREALDLAFTEHAIDAVIHLAGFKYAGVSVDQPLHTYEQNVTATGVLLSAMNDHGIDALVFSSSAAVFGTPDVDLVTETTPTAPESPYGETKLIGEWMIRDVARAGELRHTSLRYFNVVGSAVPELYDTSPHNLFPLVIRALREGRTPRINGVDYATDDGTCVRDYIHVADLADAHVVAAQRLVAGESLEPVYNLGSGDGVSVRQIMDAAAAASGVDFEPEIGPRRAGDPARIVATGELAARDLGWANRHTVAEMFSSAWNAGA